MKYPIEITGKTLKQVTKLNLSNCNLTEIPENVFQYTNLTKLVLSNNKIQIIPNNILKLRKLKTIDLSHNKIKTLQSSIFKLPHLKTLNLYHNELKNLPKQFYESNITHLIAGHNKLTYVDFNKHSSLEEIDLTFNQINSIEIGPESENLKVLRIKGNPLESCTIADIINDRLQFIDIDRKNYQVIKGNKLMEITNLDANKQKHHIFISYSHEDTKWLNMLKKHLKSLCNYYDMDEWDDQKLITSDKWEEKISMALEQASIAICLVSASFMASDYIQRKELPPLFLKAKQKGTKIIPLMVSPCAVFEDCWLSSYQAANDPKKTLAECTSAEAERHLANLMNELKILIKNN